VIPEVFNELIRIEGAVIFLSALFFIPALRPSTHPRTEINSRSNGLFHGHHHLELGMKTRERGAVKTLWLANCYSPMIPRPASICDAPSGPTSERESLPTTLHEGTARHLFPYYQIAFVYLLEWCARRDSNSRPDLPMRFSLTV